MALSSTGMLGFACTRSRVTMSCHPCRDLFCCGLLCPQSSDGMTVALLQAEVRELTEELNAARLELKAAQVANAAVATPVAVDRIPSQYSAASFVESLNDRDPNASDSSSSKDDDNERLRSHVEQLKRTLRASGSRHTDGVESLGSGLFSASRAPSAGKSSQYRHTQPQERDGSGTSEDGNPQPVLARRHRDSMDGRQRKDRSASPRRTQKKAATSGGRQVAEYDPALSPSQTKAVQNSGDKRQHQRSRSQSRPRNNQPSRSRSVSRSEQRVLPVSAKPATAVKAFLDDDPELLGMAMLLFGHHATCIQPHEPGCAPNTAATAGPGVLAGPGGKRWVL